MRTSILAAVLAVAIGGLAYLDHNEGETVYQDAISRCLSQVERQYPVEDWHSARIGQDRVSLTYQTRIRGGLMQRKASCIGTRLVSW